MVEQHKKRLINSCVVLAGLLSLTWHRAAFSALPPAATGEQAQAQAQVPAQESTSSTAPSAKPSTRGGKPATETIFLFPPVLIGGRVSYQIRSDATEGQKVVQQGITSSINAKTKTYLWQPWFAWLSGDIGLNILRQSTNSGSSDAAASNAPFASNSTLTSKNLSTTGSLQLDVLPRTNFPFEAHYIRTDNRISGELSTLNGYASQNLGFTQTFATDYGNGMFGWDHNQQSGSAAGQTQQDNLRLSLTKALSKSQNLVVGVTRTDNRHEAGGERAVQTNMNAQHNYTPDSELRIDTLANASKAAYDLKQGRTEVNLMQLSSFGTWRPEDEDFTVTGGARLLTMANSASDAFFTGNGSGSRISNANFNVGVGYEITTALRATATANMNMSGGMGPRSATASESVGLTYQPDMIQWGAYNYNWGTSGTATNSGGGGQQSRSLSLQASHGLSRSIALDGGSGLTLSLSQGISTSLSNSTGGGGGELGSGSITGSSSGTVTQRLTHSGGVSWNKMAEFGSIYLSMNASDSRSLGSPKESFQLINFQASSSMPAGRFGSLTGNLTVQAVRQETPIFFLPQDPLTTLAPKTGFVFTSSGSLSYMHSRVFGIPRLRFMSDLRLNSQALLPMLGGPQDMETASWDNNLDYSIGRTQVRMSTRLAQLAGRNNKSSMFTLSRGLGAY